MKYILLMVFLFLPIQANASVVKKQTTITHTSISQATQSGGYPTQYAHKNTFTSTSTVNLIVFAPDFTKYNNVSNCNEWKNAISTNSFDQNQKDIVSIIPNSSATHATYQISTSTLDGMFCYATLKSGNATYNSLTQYYFIMAGDGDTRYRGYYSPSLSSVNDFFLFSTYNGFNGTIAVQSDPEELTDMFYIFDSNINSVVNGVYQPLAQSITIPFGEPDLFDTAKCDTSEGLLDKMVCKVGVYIVDSFKYLFLPTSTESNHQILKNAIQVCREKVFERFPFGYVTKIIDTINATSSIPFENIELNINSKITNENIIDQTINIEQMLQGTADMINENEEMTEYLKNKIMPIVFGLIYLSILIGFLMVIHKNN